MEDLMLPWIGFQAKKYTWAVEKYFSFSPYISREYNDTFAGYDFSTMDPLRTNTNSGCFVGLMEAVLISPPWQ